MADGNTLILVTIADSLSKDVGWFAIKKDYARVGAGIVAQGENSNGKYYKFGNGLMICYGKITTSGNTARTVTFPIAFLDTGYDFKVNNYASPGTFAGAGQPSSKLVTGCSFYSTALAGSNPDNLKDWIAIGECAI